MNDRLRKSAEANAPNKNLEHSTKPADAQYQHMQDMLHKSNRLKRQRSIQTDRHKELEIRKYIQALKETEAYSIYGETTCIPSDKLNRKFTYFYKPYNFNINSKIYMTQRDYEQQQHDRVPQIEDYVLIKRIQNERNERNERNINKRASSTAQNERSTSYQDEKIPIDIENLFNEKQSGWVGVTGFLLGDPRRRRYVLGQIKQLHHDKKLCEQQEKKEHQRHGTMQTFY